MTKHRATSVQRWIMLNTPDVFAGDTLELQRTSTGGSQMFYILSKHRRIASVVKVIKGPELEGRIEPPRSILSIKGAVPQVSAILGEHVIVWRSYIENPMSAATIASLSRRADLDSDGEALIAESFISQLLSVISRLHNEGIVHGGLEPDKISFAEHGEVMLRDIGVPKVFEPVRSPKEITLGEYLNSFEFRYIPYENALNPGIEPTKSGDVWACLSIAEDVLRPYRGSAGSEKLERLDSMVGWLRDYYLTRPDRLSAQQLHSLLFASGRKEPEFPGRKNWVSRKITSLKNRLGAFDGKDKVLSYFRQYPETAVLISQDRRGRRRVRRLGGLLQGESSSSYIRSVKSRDNLAAKELTSNPQMEFARLSMPAGIDSLWTDRVHEIYFGFPRDPLHDLRIDFDSLDSEGQALRDEYLMALDEANEARAQLLDENRFLTTAGALRELSNKSGRYSRDELLVARRWGVILAVPDHGRWLYPDFQFKKGAVSPWVRIAHDQQRKWLEGGEVDPWDQLTYFCVKRQKLAGQALKDCLWEKGKSRIVQDIIRTALF